MTTYPKRPSHFAHKFCRLLFKQCVANEIGAEACWLLTVIAHTEDARHYTGAVTFFNLQLAPLVGLGSVDALDRVRRKAVAAGWLHYEPGAKGVAGRYWVLVPQHCVELRDGPTDETPNELEPVSLAVTSAKSRTNPRGECGRIREESAEPSSLSLSPSPITADAGACGGKPKPKKATKGEGDSNFARFWTAYPRKDGKKAALKVWAKIAPDDALVATILAAVDRRRRSADWLKDDGRFIPHAAKWLNGERWEDGGPEPGAAPEPPRVKRATDNPLVGDNFDYAPFGG